jgi:hypothetical protein
MAARQRARRCCSRCGRIGTPLLDTFRRMPYTQIGTIANDPPEAPPLFTASDGGGLRDLSSDAIDSLLRVAGDRAAGIFLVEARHLGGALARQPEASMPFGFRSPWFISALATAPTPEALQGGKRSIGTLLQALKPDADRRAADQQPGRRQYWPAAHTRCLLSRELPKAGRTQGRVRP